MPFPSPPPAPSPFALLEPPVWSSRALPSCTLLWQPTSRMSRRASWHSSRLTDTQRCLVRPRHRESLITAAICLPFPTPAPSPIKKPARYVRCLAFTDLSNRKRLCRLIARAAPSSCRSESACYKMKLLIFTRESANAFCDVK